MIDEQRWSWRDQPGVTWAAGAAAVGLIALLVFAVIRTSTSSHPPELFTPATSSSTAESSRAPSSPTTSTSYSMPSVLTSEGVGPEVSAPPTVDTSASEGPGASTSTTTTTPNPYVTTTTQNGGAV